MKFQATQTVDNLVFYKNAQIIRMPTYSYTHTLPLVH